MATAIRTAVVDDERSARRAVALQLQALDGVEVVGEADGGAAAVRLIREADPDVVFLDVQMPDLDGFGVLEALAPAELPHVVFVTAHDEFAIRAFDVNAVDYLLKPVDDRKLRRALDRVREHTEPGAPPGLRRLMEYVRGQDGPDRYRTRILVKEKGEYAFVSVDEIQWIEAEGNYARLHTGRGTHLIRASLTGLDDELDPSVFLRVHRGAIVNLDRVRSIQPYGGADYNVILESGKTVRVGRTYRDRLLQRE